VYSQSFWTVGAGLGLDSPERGVIERIHELMMRGRKEKADEPRYPL